MYPMYMLILEQYYDEHIAVDLYLVLCFIQKKRKIHKKSIIVPLAFIEF